MKHSLRFLVLASILAASIGTKQTPLDQYLEKEEPLYSWYDTGQRIDGIYGTQIHVLNVTSQQWLSEGEFATSTGSVWTHQVAVVLPDGVKAASAGFALLTGRCNNDFKVEITEEYLALADLFSYSTKAVTIVVYQIPNCPLVFKSDLKRAERREDAILAWAWRQYIETNNSHWLPRLPMVKAAFQAMRAVSTYLRMQNISITGWVVSGASKRGWTTWLVGASRCQYCPRIDGIIPMVPIVPALSEEVHDQYKSYGGFTFAFRDYEEAGILRFMDGKAFHSALEIIDPIHYLERLEHVPKLVVLSSDDEFMQFDWSNIWYNRLKGERALLILDNSEHSLITAIPELLPAMMETFRVFTNGGEMPQVEHTYNGTTGSINLTLFNWTAKHVRLRYAHTLHSTRRDFPWVRLAEGNCNFPEVRLKNPVFGGGNCIQPIIWHEKTLKPTIRENCYEYLAEPPRDKNGRWTGYYLEIIHASGLRMTSPGYIWPTTFPYKDCKGDQCKDNLV